MELRQLTYFAQLYREGNVTRAAQSLNIVQPALSMQIAKLESELGLVLFERTSKGMTPTPAGERAFELFSPILEQVLKARHELTGDGQEIRGRVRVGLVASATNAALAETLAYFIEHHPDVEIYVTTGFSTELVEKLRAGDLDCVVINQTFGQEEFAGRQILDEELVLATGVDTTLPIDSPVPLHALASLKLVLPSPRHGLRRAIENVLRAHSIEVHPRLEIDDTTVIELFIKRTDWVSILPASMVNRELLAGNLQVHPLAPPGISRRMLCLRDPSRPSATAETAFIDVLATKLGALQAATTALTHASTEDRT
jgi:LysR family nitrogen assimilation transcriptional regulator